MGKVFGILLVVVGLWATGEIYTKGTTGAFGGMLVQTGMVEADGEPAQDLGRRSGAKVGDAHAAADSRRDRLLAE